MGEHLWNHDFSFSFFLTKNVFCKFFTFTASVGYFVYIQEANIYASHSMGSFIGPQSNPNTISLLYNTMIYCVKYKSKSFQQILLCVSTTRSHMMSKAYTDQHRAARRHTNVKLKAV